VLETATSKPKAVQLPSKPQTGKASVTADAPLSDALVVNSLRAAGHIELQIPRLRKMRLGHHLVVGHIGDRPPDPQHAVKNPGREAETTHMEDWASSPRGAKRMISFGSVWSWFWCRVSARACPNSTGVTPDCRPTLEDGCGAVPGIALATARR
jgi:hypothetical protein